MTGFPGRDWALKTAITIPADQLYYRLPDATLRKAIRARPAAGTASNAGNGACFAGVGEGDESVTEADGSAVPFISAPAG